MFESSRALIATCLALSACATEAPPPTAPASKAPAPPPAIPPETLASDSPRNTPGGTTFIAPSGWTLKSDGPRLTLEAPEPDLLVAVVDAQGATADAAVASAWSTLHASFVRALKIAQDKPARFGWDERRRYVYETSPNERLVIYAQALRKGTSWTVALVEGSEPAFERRIASVRLITESIRPSGYVRETFAGKTARLLDAARIQEITKLIESGREQAGVPGVALSLVQGGKVIFEGGFGLRELDKKGAVDADTLFIIASNTKALSTLLLAKLIDEGKFQWDTPVQTVYPSFKLGDAETTEKVLIKHLVCACTGLPRQDYEWLFEFKGATAKQEMDLLGTMQPTTKFGETFQYSNILASAAGFTGGHSAYPKLELGAAYDEAMRSRVFGPLAMKATTFDFARALKGNHASPHSEDLGGKPALASMDVNRAVIPLRPAGGAWSSARDLIRYVQLELANGKLADGKQHLSEVNLLARRAPQVSVGEDEVYGMGLSIDRKYGIPVVHHGGSMIGYKSDMFWLPEQGVGGVILTNADSGGLLLRPLLRRVLELLFDGQPEAVEDLAASVKQRQESIKKERERLVAPPDPALLGGLAKAYGSSALGEIDITQKGEATIFDFGEWKSAMASRKNDDGSVSFVTIDPGVDGFEFVVSEREGKRALIVRDMQHEYLFLER